MWIVRLALRRPYTFVVASLVLLLLTPFVLWRTPTDIFPAIDIPVVSAAWIYNGLNAQEIEQRIVYNHERMIATLVDNIDHVQSTAYNGAAVITVFLRPGASVDAGVAQITATGQAILRLLPPGITPPIIIRYNASTVPILQYSFASKKRSESELRDLAFNQVRVGLANVKGASIPYPYGGKARVVAVDLDLAALKAKNLSPVEVVNALNAQNLILPSGTAKIGSTEYDVSRNSSPIVLEELGEGDAQLLANLATLRRTSGPPIVNHYNVMPVIDVLACTNGRDLRGVLRDIQPLIAEAEKELSRGSSIILRGQAQTMNSSFLGLGLGLVMATALIYLLLVVNFQSWLDPFIILAALPGALAGVVWGLYLTYTTLSVPALMGAIMTLGVATANSLLVVSFARNHLRDGTDPLTAAWESGTGRLRPVLMTALAMIMGMLPMALGPGEGGEQNAPLGRAVIGGLIVATFATLFFVPAVFRLLHGRIQVTRLEDFDAIISATTTRQEGPAMPVAPLDQASPPNHLPVGPPAGATSATSSFSNRQCWPDWVA